MKGEFWTWLLEAYKKPGISDAVIALQDREGLNVNAVFLCCWLACKHARLSQATAGEIERLSPAWADTIVAPVRAVRRALKTSDLIDEERRKDIRGRIQSIEIDLEELHCALLESRAAADVGAPQDEPEALSELAGDNLREYLAARQLAPADQGRIVRSNEWQTLVKATCLE